MQPSDKFKQLVRNVYNNSACGREKFKIYRCTYYGISNSTTCTIMYNNVSLSYIKNIFWPTRNTFKPLVSWLFFCNHACLIFIMATEKQKPNQFKSWSIWKFGWNYQMKSNLSFSIQFNSTYSFFFPSENNVEHCKPNKSMAYIR